MEFALCLSKRLIERMIAFALRDKCFVFQTFAFILQRPLLFIELKTLGEQAIKELLCFQFKFEYALQRGLERKHTENVLITAQNVLLVPTNLERIISHVIAML